MNSTHRSVLLTEYMREVELTDKLPPDDLQPVLLGLFGEVGSIMATAKKLHRDKKAYAGYRHDVEEEFGDALWYLTSLCRRLGVGVDEIVGEVASGSDYTSSVAANDLVESPVSHVATPGAVPELDSALLQLGESATSLFALRISQLDSRTKLSAFADWYLRALTAARVTFAEVVNKNITKIRSRFREPDYALLPTFDDNFPEQERLPHEFEILINQRDSGRSYMQWNGVFIGDPLTDNIRDPDGFRFHDVFHFAHVAILHWSPTIRGLIKRKRKSDSKVDEAQDGGRAIVIEEGLTAWIFARSKQLNYFEGQKSLSLDLLKTVQQFVSGYEVEACPLRLWEIAILSGFEVFRQVKAANSGVITGNRAARTITYRPLSENKA